MQIQIKNRWSGEVIFETEAASLRIAVELAIKAKANLSKADLSEADLSWANLSEANLSKADLSWANLSKADLSEADLSWANLYKADLSKADLSEADLSWANLSKADLSEADLSVTRDDIWAVLSSAPSEVEGLRAALAEGRVDGSTYTGECACLVGTIANVRGCSVDNLGALKKNSSRAAEMFFLGIKKGDTPETNPVSKLALQWVDEWLFNMRTEFGGAVSPREH